MKKDYNKSDFESYMQSMCSYWKFILLEQRANTFDELNRLDELEVEVSSRPCYNSVEEMINAVKEM